MTKNNTSANKYKNAKLTILVGAIIVLGVIFWLVYSNTNKLNSDTAVEEKNKNNAAVIKEEKNKESIVITDSNKENIVETVSPEQGSTDGGSQPSYDDYGPSTKLDRPDVHAVVLAINSLYSDLLLKLQAVPESQRQTVADQFLANNSSYFSPSFNYLSSDSLHLFPQSASLALPQSVRVYSAILDPESPNQVLVQIGMEPNIPWTIIAVVKTKDSLGNFGTFEKLIPRMNKNPL